MRSVANMCVLGGYQNHQIVAYRNLDELTRRMGSISVRATKAEALDLPDQIFEDRVVRLTAKERQIYDQVRRDSFAELDNGDRLTAATVLHQAAAFAANYRRFSCSRTRATNPSRPARPNWMRSRTSWTTILLQTGEKLVVFARFRTELDAICKLLEARFTVRFDLR